MQNTGDDSVHNTFEEYCHMLELLLCYYKKYSALTSQQEVLDIEHVLCFMVRLVSFPSSLEEPLMRSSFK